MNFKRLTNLTGWVVFTIAFIVYFLSAERFGSLWDCGEFIAGAYKLQVVHPPGAPFFILVGRMFTKVAEIFSDNPADIAFAVNLMSGVCTAFMAAFVAWMTILLAKMALYGRGELEDNSSIIALSISGLVGGLTSAFCTSIWFSAVEGEVYAMSTFFTALVVWLAVKWYHRPDTKENDKLLVLAVFCMGLSIGVHLLSLLTMPVIALLYYLKKYDKISLKGMIIAPLMGVVLIGIIQKLIITGIPVLWSKFELFMVNSLGMPFNSGLLPVLIVVLALVFFGLRYAEKNNRGQLQMIIVSLALIVVSFTSFGVVLIRAGADTPINMNNPSDAYRILPYLNREQYGERPLLFGPDFDAQPYKTSVEDRYGKVDDGYAIVDKKVSYEYKSSDKRFFPRLGHNTMGRPSLYRMWLDLRENEKPSGIDNFKFFFRYQIRWMYLRYFMWNFTGRQNGEQGYFDWDSSAGNWESGINFIDEMRLHETSKLPSFMKNDQGKNHYFFIPLILGLLGVFFHYKHNKNEFVALLALFVITGIGIIIYSNQPPNEPRERDYVLAGSFFTFSIWVGMGAMFLFHYFRNKLNNSNLSLGVAGLAIIAPILMLTQNFDDLSRRNLSGAVDYANNFLESCDENAIIFTYGDNDTYPLWYAQEVQGIRTDVRVVNLSLLQVDWYINQLRRKVNDSPPIKMTIQADAIRGFKRNQIAINQAENMVPLKRAVQYMAEDHPKTFGSITVESLAPSKNLFIPIDKNKMLSSGIVDIADTARLQSKIDIKLKGSSLVKDEITMLDIIANNFPDRPIYWAITVQVPKLMGLEDYLELEGLALKLTPLKKTQKDGFEAYGIYGKGTADADRIHEVVTTKWKWGGFDDHELFVDDSFGPSIQSIRMVVTRASANLIAQKKYTKAQELLTTFLKGFPNKNFPYNQTTMPIIVDLFEAKAIEEGKVALTQLTRNVKEWGDFVNSLSPEDAQNTFRDEGEIYGKRLPQQLPAIANKYVDEAFAKEIDAILKASN